MLPYIQLGYGAFDDTANDCWILQVNRDIFYFIMTGIGMTSHETQFFLYTLDQINRKSEESVREREGTGKFHRTIK